MPANSLGLQVLWWGEMIISARALLFLVPVMISRWQEQHFSIATIDDWFLWVATICAVFYFLVGICSVLGHRLWRLFHYVGLILVAVLTAGFMQTVVQRQAPVYPVYWLPAVFALAAATGAALSRLRSQPRRA